VIGGILGILLILFIEKKRRERKRAMERYAMKRMRRKFKAMQQGENTTGDNQPVDWRILYQESKEVNIRDCNNRSSAAHNRTEWTTKTVLDRITLTMQFPKGSI
jgi:hypothetical protein